MTTTTAPVRIPLQLGNSAVLGRLRASALFLPSLVLLFAWIAVPGWISAWADDTMGDPMGSILGTIALVPGLALGVLAIVGMAFASEGADDAKKQMPSDLVLARGSVKVEGGPHDGVTIAWRELAGVVVERNASSDAGAMLRMFAAILRFLRLRRIAGRLHAEVWELRVGKRVLGSAVARGEIESLRLLAQTLRALAEEPKTSDPPPPSSPEVIACPGCGGAATPADLPAVKCRFCDREVEMPAEIRERIRAHAQVRGAARHERMIRRLLDQPGATWAARWLRLGAIVMRFAWPLALGVLLTLVIMNGQEEDELPRIVLRESQPFPFARDLLLSAALAFACFAGVTVALDAYFANRRALRLVTLDFGATPPVRAAASWSCRVCAAPLPDSDRMLARCVYCSAENVLGIDLRRQGARSEAQSRGIAPALRHRRRARIRLAVVLVLLLGASALLGRELVWTALAAHSRPEYAYFCFLCKTARLHNRDGTRHLVRVTTEEKQRARVVPAHGEVDVECEYECTVHLGTQSYTITEPTALAIEGGWLMLDR
jgi:hypothetical protein